jgi:5-methylcytosine-specific restriction endonuclease McrA
MTMSDKSRIEWTEATWHTITAAKRIGVPVDEYVSRINSGEKWCTGCKEWHSRTLFYVDRSRSDGLAASCKGRAKRYPVQLRLFDEEEKRARCNALYRQYYAGPAGAAIRERVYARKRNLDPIPAWWREETLQEGCAYCGAPAGTLDHVIPVSTGGKSEPGNLVPACATCNSKKKDSDPRPWIAIMRPEFIERICTRPMTGIGALEILDEVA